MQPLRAHIRNGRLLLDVPTDLPEGELMLQPVNGFISLVDDGLNDEERAQLHRELEASIEEADRGCTEDFAKVLAELRQRR